MSKEPVTDSILDFVCGAFLVHDKSKGGDANEVGWAYITIKNKRIIEIGHIENTVKRLDKRRFPLMYIHLNSELSQEQLELTSIMCNRSFNTCFSYNFAQKSTYLHYAEEFFNSLKN